MWSEFTALASDLPADFWPLAGGAVAFWLAFFIYRVITRAISVREERRKAAQAKPLRHFSLPSRAGRI